METTANNGGNSLNAPNAVPVTDVTSSNVVALGSQDTGSDKDNQCEGGVCILSWKPKRPPRTEAA